MLNTTVNVNGANVSISASSRNAGEYCATIYRNGFYVSSATILADGRIKWNPSGRGIWPKMLPAAERGQVEGWATEIAHEAKRAARSAT